MALAYRPPNVTVAEVVTPSTSPLLATPARICLVGLTQGYQVRTDQFVLSGTTGIALPGLPANAAVSSVVSVKDALDPSKGAADGSGYTVTTDYTVNVGAGTVSRVGGGGIADGTLVNVTYQYIPADYFDPYLLDDFASVESRYGSALNAAGTAINSPVSYAAGVAFENGASELVIQPLFVRQTPGDPSTARAQPNATQQANSNTWSDTLFLLRDIDEINVIVPIVGQSQANVTDSAELAIFQTVQDHISFMKSQEQYIIGIFGEDSSASSSVAQKTTLRNHAATIQGRYGGATSEQLVLIAPSKFVRPSPVLSPTPFYVGGQFVAAAISGMIASRPVSSSLTRKIIAGFLGVSATGADFRSLNDKNTDASLGLLVVEQNGGVVQIRHSITLDNTATARRELNVVRAKHRMIESVRDTINRQIIGNIVADGNAAGLVQSTVVGVLEGLRQQGDLVDYSAVQARLTSIDPTLVQVRFSYRPAFPLNYVDITFSLDLTGGAVTTNTPA